MQTNTGRSTPPGAGSPGTGRRVDLPWRRVGITGGLVGILCYVGPTVLALFGVISGATALAWGTDLYDGYASWFCGAGLLVLAGLVWWTLRRRDACSVRCVRAQRVRILAALGVAVATYLALYALTTWLGTLA